MSNKLQEKIESLEKSVFFLEQWLEARKKTTSNELDEKIVSLVKECDSWHRFAFSLWKENHELKIENEILEDRLKELESVLPPSCVVKSD